MITGTAWIEVLLPHDRKLFAPLKELGTYEYSSELKGYLWRFPAEKIEKVSTTLGKPIVLGARALRAVESLNAKSKQDVSAPPSQGVGFTEVSSHPKKPGYFMVTTVREKKPQNISVSYGTVQALWRVVKKQPLNTKVLTATIAKGYCKELGITGFNTYKDGGFNWKYFSGSRKHYLHFYSAIKVLVHYRVAEHIVSASKSGIKRTKDIFKVQTLL